MLRPRLLFSSLAVVISLGLLTGCGEHQASDARPHADDHDHHHAHDHEHDHDHHHDGEGVEESFSVLVERIDGLNAKIKDAFERGEVDEADGYVHDIGHELEKLVASLKEETDEAVQGAADKLFDEFDKVDQQLHGGEGASYDDVREEIEAALQTLRQRAETQKEEVEP